VYIQLNIYKYLFLFVIKICKYVSQADQSITGSMEDTENNPTDSKGSESRAQYATDAVQINH